MRTTADSTRGGGSNASGDLTQFLDRVGDLEVGISRDFLVPMAA